MSALTSDGTIGQANYSTAKAAITGLTRTLAIEGARANIKVNCIAPRAGTAMTETVWPKELVEAMKPDFIAPVVGYLASEQCEDTGTLQEVFGGYAAGVRWQRTYGVTFPNDREIQPEEIAAKWNEVTKFGEWFLSHIFSQTNSIHMHSIASKHAYMREIGHRLY